MGKKLSTTPRSRVRSALRQVWLRSRERAAAIKREGGCCEICNQKQSKAKGRELTLEIHHREGIEWDNILDYVYRHLLIHPDGLEVLCKKCHTDLHEEEKL